MTKTETQISLVTSVSRGPCDRSVCVLCRVFCEIVKCNAWHRHPETINNNADKLNTSCGLRMQDCYIDINTPLECPVSVQWLATSQLNTRGTDSTALMHMWNWTSSHRIPRSKANKSKAFPWSTSGSSLTPMDRPSRFAITLSPTATYFLILSY